MQLLARRLTHGQQDVVPVIVAQPVQRGQPVANRGPDPGQGAWIGRAPTHLPETRGTDVCQLISLRQARRRSYRRARFSTAANPSTCGGVMTRIRPPPRALSAACRSNGAGGYSTAHAPRQEPEP